jgi:hypothetical protein
MRKTIYIFLIFGFISCSNEEVKETSTVIETPKIVELSPDEFNSFLTIRINALHELIVEMQELDEADVAPDVLIAAAQKYSANLESMIVEINEVSATGDLVMELKDLTIKYIGSKIAILKVYVDFAPQLSIESEWTDEDYSNWTSQAEPYFGISDQIFDELSSLQEQFLVKNNLTPTEI